MGVSTETLYKALSYKPGASELTLYDPGSAVDTGYTPLLEGRDFGNDEWELFFSGPRGTQGQRAAGAIPQNRRLVLPWRVQGVSKGQLHDRLSALHAVADEMRRFGGRVTWRAQGQTYRQFFEVMAGTAAISEWPKRYDHSNILTQVFSAICAPYLLGDPYDFLDTFDADSSADYTIDAGVGRLNIQGGELVPASTGNVRWRHTARGYRFGDCQATLKLRTGSTTASINVGVFINADTSGVETYFAAELVAGKLRIVKRVAGVATTITETAFLLTTNTTYWLRIQREGRQLIATVFTSEPTALATPAAGIAGSLFIIEALQYPSGHAGFRIDVVSTTERYDDFRVEPHWYGWPSAIAGRSLILPDDRQLRPTIPGDAPALAELVFSNNSNPIPIWALFGSYLRPSIWNYCWNGDFENDVDGWSVAAVTGINAAGTSIVQNTTAARNKYGGGNGQIVCPATVDTGANFKLNRRFYQGRDYVALLWASSAFAVTSARARLGVNTDIMESTYVNLSATPALYVVRWSPTADRDGAYLAFTIAAATGTTMNIDGGCVFESRPAPIAADINATDTTVTVTGVPDDWPKAPFMAVIDDELILVESINYTTKVLTIRRGREGSVANSHLVAGPPASPISPVPEFRSHFEGKGAQPALSVIEAESADTGNLFTWAIASGASRRLGNELTATGLNAAGSVAADYLIDPHLLVGDAYTQGEIAVEVWGRISLHSGLTNPTVVLAAAPESATVASGVLSSNFGAIRYSEEFGTSGKVLTKPSSGAAYRLYRLGTIRLPVDRSNPLRSRLQVRIAWSAAASASIAMDYLILDPATSRCLSPSGKPNDANYPKFISSNAETLKRIRCDLSGQVSKPPFAAHPDHGLGGSLLELPVGNVDFLAKFSDLVPDDPTSDTTAETAENAALALHLAITPRYAIARGSS